MSQLLMHTVEASQVWEDQHIHDTKQKENHIYRYEEVPVQGYMYRSLSCHHNDFSVQDHHHVVNKWATFTHTHHTSVKSNAVSEHG